MLVRNCHDGESKGILIGPVVSNVLAELVMQRIDASLVAKGHQFVRYIDDYTSYAPDRSGAERFVVDLQHALSEYRLDVNTRKTRITDLREVNDDPWMTEIRMAVPLDASPLAAARFLRHAELLAKRYPLYSVLKFAVKTRRGRAEADRVSSILIVDELVRLCAFHPHLAPFLASELDTIAEDLSEADTRRIAGVLEKLMTNAAERAETDIVLWYLHILRRILNHQIKKAAWKPLIEMNDDLVLLQVMILCPRSRPAAKRLILGWDYYSEAVYQQHWLIRYEMFRVGLLLESDLTDLEKEWMEIMRKHRVSFSALK